MQTEPCGACGERVRRCTDDCTWGEWSGCQSEGVCAPGEEDARGCGGACAAQVRTCTAQCEWSDWGECQGGGQCEPGQLDRASCGNCGERQRNCTDACIWGEWSNCSNQGECEAGRAEARRCGTDRGICEFGVEERRCDQSCEWTDWGACRDGVEPQREICGDALDQDCNGRVERDPDEFEPNDSCDSCWVLQDGEVDVNVFLNATMDSIEDRNDYFCFNADDGFNVPGFGEDINITLSNVPADADYDIFLYKGRANCNAGRSLASSLNGRGEDDQIDWNETNGDDDGEYVVRVRRVSGHSCNSEYRLDVRGLD
jgi:hypothetical protein